MDSETFWSLTWQDWCLWALRIVELQRRRKEDHELAIEMTRSFMSLFANANRSRNTPPFHPHDFFKLSYDTAPKKDDSGNIDDKELFEEMKKRFKVKR